MRDFLQRLGTDLRQLAEQLLQDIFSPQRALDLVTAALIVLIGWVVAKAVRHTLRRVLRQRLSVDGASMVERGAGYGILTVAVLTALSQMGVEIGVLLGAAGVVTVGLSFAAQTSLSNLISGLFLLAERPFHAGDKVRIGTTTGEVLQVDLLSVKLRTFDNLSVRIPNETLLKAEIINLTHFPIRRADVQLTVGHETDFTRCEDELRQLVEALPEALDEPKPIFSIRAVHPQGVEVLFGVWSPQEGFIAFRTQLLRLVLERLRSAGVEVALPQQRVVVDPELLAVLGGASTGDSSTGGSSAESPPKAPPIAISPSGDGARSGGDGEAEGDGSA
ncbi:MAG: mechanosensitive ion channel [Acidobacteriota bacterium]